LTGWGRVEKETSIREDIFDSRGFAARNALLLTETTERALSHMDRMKVKKKDEAVGKFQKEPETRREKKRVDRAVQESIGMGDRGGTPAQNCNMREEAS